MTAVILMALGTGAAVLAVTTSSPWWLAAQMALQGGALALAWRRA